MRVRPRIFIAVGVLVLGGLLAIGWLRSHDSNAEGGRGRTQPTRAAEAPAARQHGGVEERESDAANSLGKVVGGSLIDEETGPLAEGRVDLFCDDARSIARAPIDADGNFEGPACSGRTCARLVHATFEQPEPWVLEPGVRRQLAVVAAPTLAGTVVSTSGEPIPDAKFLLRLGPMRASARSDVDGAFTISLPRARPCDPCDGDARVGCRAPEEAPTDGSASLLVWAPQFAPQELELTFERDEPLRVVLSPPAPPITGRVVGSDGTPIGLRFVVLATHREREAEQHAAEVSADGSFSFADLAHAEYRLRAIRDGHELAMLDSAAPGDQVELRVAQTLQGRDLHIEVRDDLDRPTPAVRVDGGPFRGAKTDARGRVEAREVLPGSYTLSVRLAGCPVVRTTIDVDVESGLDPMHQLVRLPAACVIPGPQ